MTDITVLNDDDNKITTIYHFADIHIKSIISSDLYEHYIDMIDKIQNSIKKQIKPNDNSLICICGDIIDTIYSTECIKVIKLFFNKLAFLCPVVYIVGSHDLSNKRNLDVSDMITPLIHEYFDSKYDIYPLLKEGLYQYNNVIFGVTKMGSTCVLPCKIKNKIKIGLYHGQVSYPELDPIVKKQCDLDVEDFKKIYDFTFLGDRHTYGHLDKEKTVAYSGSIYEVNYRETGIKKGFIKWNLIKKESKFIEIDSIIKHKILKIKDNKLVSNNSNDYNKVKIKMIYDDDTKIENLDEIEKKIKKEYNVIEYILEKDFSSTSLNTNITIGNKQKTIDDIKSYDVVLKMITDHIREKYKTDKKITLKIEEYLKKLIKEIDFNFFEKPTMFKLKKLQFDNINSYGENNVIDFSLFNNKICEISGPNGMGKSTILTVLLLGLYNECDIGAKYDCLNIKNIEKGAKIIVEFDVNGEQYKIDKKIYVRSHAKRECYEDLLLFKNGKDITGQDNNETQKKINNLIGTYDNIIDTNIILQRNYKAFTDLSNNDKKKVISKISKLDVFDIMAKQVRSELASLQKKIPMLTKQVCDMFDIEKTDNYLTVENEMVIDTDIIKDEVEKLSQEKETLNEKQIKLNKCKIELEFELKDFKNLKKQLQSTLKDTKGQLSIKKKEFVENEEEIEEIKCKLFDKKFKNFEERKNKFNEKNKIEISNLIEEKNKLLLDVTKISFNNENMRNKIEFLKDKIKGLENEMNELDDSIVIDYNNYIKLKNTLDEQLKQTKKINDEIKKYKDKQKHVNKIDHDPDCNYCVKLVNKLTFKENIEILVEELNGIKKEKDRNDKKIKKYKNIQRKYDDYLKSADNNKKLENEIKFKIKDLENLQCEYNKNVKIEKNNKLTNNKIQKINDKLDELKKQSLDGCDEYNELIQKKKELADKNDKIKMVINDLQSRVDNFENINKMKKLNETTEELNKINNKLKVTTQSIENKNKIITRNEITLKQVSKMKNEIDELKQEKQIIEYVSKTLEKDGIQDTILIKNIIPKLQQEINNLLSTLSNFNIEIKYLNKTLQVYKIVNKKDRILKLSGYEHMILGLCFRLVFCGLTQQKCKFLCFDEIFTFADDNGIQKIGQLFDYIRSRFNFALVISHNDNIKKFCDVSLNIEKKIGFSKISK